MRQLSCMCADVYCQKLNNHFNTTTSFLYSNGKKGKRASSRRDRERERECERWSVAENGVGAPL
jgi:hypothetical protein